MIQLYKMEQRLCPFSHFRVSLKILLIQLRDITIIVKHMKCIILIRPKVFTFISGFNNRSFSGITIFAGQQQIFPCQYFSAG